MAHLSPDSSDTNDLPSPHRYAHAYSQIFDNVLILILKRSTKSNFALAINLIKANVLLCNPTQDLLARSLLSHDDLLCYKVRQTLVNL